MAYSVLRAVRCSKKLLAHYPGWATPGQLVSAGILTAGLLLFETFAARTKRRQIHAHRDSQPKREVPKSLITMRTEQDRTSRIVERSRQTTAWIRFARSFRPFPVTLQRLIGQGTSA